MAAQSQQPIRATHRWRKPGGGPAELFHETLGSGVITQAEIDWAACRGFGRTHPAACPVRQPSGCPKDFDVIAQPRANSSQDANNRVVFNISGNKCRLVVKVDCELQVIYIRFIGSQADYDKIEASSI